MKHFVIECQFDAETEEKAKAAFSSVVDSFRKQTERHLFTASVTERTETSAKLLDWVFGAKDLEDRIAQAEEILGHPILLL